MSLIRRISLAACLICTIALPGQEQESEPPNSQPAPTAESEQVGQNIPPQDAQPNSNQTKNLTPLEIRNKIRVHANIAMPQDI